MRLETAAAENIVCIYCKQTEPRPARGEHIVQRGLGGSSCIQCVCEGCNTGVLQELDEEFLRSSPVAYARVLLSKQGQLRSPGIVPSGLFNGWLDCVVRAPGAGAHLVPQVVIHNGRLTTVISKPDQVGARKALLQLEQRGFDAVHVDVDPRADNYPTRLVLLPKEKKNKYSFTLRARTREDAETFLAAYRARGDDFGKVMAWTDVDLQLGTGVARISSDVNVPGRGAAKVAFNVFAHYFGADIALGNEFDAVRSYIRGDDVLPVEDVPGPDGEVGFTMDPALRRTVAREAARQDLDRPGEWPHARADV